MTSMRTETFWARVLEMGLEECIPALKTKGLTTYAKFAFGSDYTPQQADTSTLATQLLKPIVDGKEELIPLLRMLWWESWGVATADLKRAAEGNEGDAPRRLSAAELETRRTLVTQRLVGVTISSELDVSDSLITACVAMYDGNRLRYIPWEMCTTRSLELIGQKKDETFTRDPVTGFLKIEAAAAGCPADVATDLKVDMALRRRGLALEMADAMTWEKHERLREELMSTLARRQPPGYNQVSIAQIRRADEVAFTVLAKLTSKGIKKVNGAKPMDDHIDAALAHRDVNIALQPLPGGRGGGDFSQPAHKRDASEAVGGQQSGLSRRAAKKARMTEQSPLPQPQQQGADKGKGKGKSTGKLPLPLRARGVASSDGEGNPVCFGFNLGSCTAAPPGGRCPKGRHVCALTTCGQSHAYVTTHGGAPQ